MTAVLGSPAYRVVERCRVCGETELTPVLSLGSMPLANSFVSPERAADPEPRYPLALVRSPRCGLLQLSVVVRPELMFADYLYASSASSPMVAHFDRLAAELVERFVPPGGLAVEIGSNDGILLGPLAGRGARSLGVEPAANLAAAANGRGLETWNEFFGEDTARRIAAEKGPASVVAANNVLAHIDDLPAVLRALDGLLDERGVFVAEVPYVLDLLARVEYDTIYHEHLSYFALAPLARLFEGAGFELFDADHLAVHGGSLRVFAARRGRREPTDALARLLELERAAGLDDGAAYVRFAERVAASREALRSLLADLRARDQSVAAIGASAKGNTLLNYCAIGPETVAFVGDSTPAKQGLLTPGTHIPVRPERAIDEERPAYTLLLAWNHDEAILRKFAAYQRSGGRFIHPVPLARVVSAPA